MDVAARRLSRLNVARLRLPSKCTGRARDTSGRGIRVSLPDARAGVKCSRRENWRGHPESGGAMRLYRRAGLFRIVRAAGVSKTVRVGEITDPAGLRSPPWIDPYNPTAGP